MGEKGNWCQGFHLENFPWGGEAHWVVAVMCHIHVRGLYSLFLGGAVINMWRRDVVSMP